MGLNYSFQAFIAIPGSKPGLELGAVLGPCMNKKMVRQLKGEM